MSRLGLEIMTVFGMPPVEYVHLAADVGCGHIALALGPTPWNPCSFAAWSLTTDAALRRETKAALAERGIIIAHAEGFGVRPQIDIASRAHEMDLCAELGAQRINTVSMEPDFARSVDQIALLAEMAAARGMLATLEFAPPHPVGTLDQAVAMIAAVGAVNLRLTMDAMHFHRAGGTAAQLAALDPAMIGYIQLCDAPMVAPHDDYMREACFERRVPGQGDLPLSDFLAALPDDVLIGLEVPMLSAVEAGESIGAIVRRVADAGHRMLLESSVA